MTMPAIRYINLDRATERRAFMERQGEALGLTLERVRAVEAADIAPDELARLSASWERDLSGGEVGCFLSHRGEWERVVREGRPALILEDDAVLSRRLPEALRKVGTIGDIDLLNLEDVGRKRFLAKGDGVPIAGGVRRVRCLRDKSGSGGYVIWPPAAARLLRQTQGRAMPSDACIHGAGLRAFVCEPPLVLQDEILVAYGTEGQLAGGSFVQPGAGEGRKPRARNLRQLTKRAATQARLLPVQLRRLTDVVYRRVECDPSDFS